ncbi:MAG TPA: hypothetical protein VGK63_02895 [Candidatus Limnocylindrales bacterium]
MIRPPAASLAVVLLAAACTGGVRSPSDSPSPTPEPIPSDGHASLVIRVDNEGGFIAPTATLSTLPVVAVFDDGRILQPAPVPAIYPGPLVPPLNVRDVGRAGVAAIRAAVATAGLGETSSATPGPGLPDAGTVVFRAVVDGREVVNRFAGPLGGPSGSSGSAGAEARRTAAFGLLDRLTDPGESWGAPPTTETPYDPAGFRVFAVPGAPPDRSLPQTSVAWPLATKLAELGEPVTPDRGIDGLRSGDVVGSDADRLKAVFGAANSLTPFTSDGRTWTLYVRPLLPDEVP